MNNDKPAFRLVPHSIPRDVVQALEKLLEEARRGEVLGFAYVVLYKSDRSYDYGNKGECDRNPLFTRCLVAELDDYLSVQTKKRAVN